MSTNIPARVGDPVEQVDTPCLLINLDAYERNIGRMARYVREQGLRHRAHAKTHKCPNIALHQIASGAVGVCCQKVSEAEAMVNGGVRDVLVSNEVVNPRMIERLAALSRQARVQVCVDDMGNIGDLDAAARRYDTRIEALVEIDVGAGRCGVEPGRAAVPLAKRIADSEGLRFAGLQAYQGKAQHVYDYQERKASIDSAVTATRETVELLEREGLSCDIVGGAGTGTYAFEGESGVFNELQCGSYVFMDADYQRIRMADGRRIDEFENSLFIYSTVMSKTRAEKAICDAGLKAQSVDSGVAVVHGRDDVEYVGASDEHGVIRDPGNRLRLGEKLRLVPGHCDPTVNLYDWFVGVRDGRVECLWPIAARGMSL